MSIVVEEGVRNGHHFTIKKAPLTYAELYVVRTGNTIAEARSLDEAKSLLDKVLGDESQATPRGTEERRGDASETLPGHGREDDNRRGSESD